MTKEEVLQKVTDYCNEKSYTNATLTEGFRDKFADHFQKAHPDGNIEDEAILGSLKFALSTAFSSASELATVKVNEFTSLAPGYDGFVFGSPVYYAGMNGAMKSFMDRVFYSASKSGREPFYLKPAAAVVSARRAGTTSALDQMNKYFLYAQMPVVSSRYWNMVHGNKPEDVLKDEEGLQIMRVLARNMAWLLKIKEAGEKAGIKLPRREEKISFNYIR